MNLDIPSIRTDFPILSRSIRGKQLVYFDNGATNQKPIEVIERMSDYYRNINSNVHRGVHFLSQIATDAMENARATVRDFLHAASIEEIIFTKGTTESINLVAHSYGKAFVRAGDEIIVSEMEHHANIVPWQMLCEEKGAILKVAKVNDDGSLDLDYLNSLFTPRTKLLAITHISNVMGIINPIQQIISHAHQNGIHVLVDGAQAVPHTPVDVQTLDADFYVFSSHKMYGPMGVGILYGKHELLQKMPPYQTGGEMIKEVSFEKTTFNELPFKFEAGTPMVAEILGLATAIEYIQRLGISNIEAYEKELFSYANQQLIQIKGITILGTAVNKASTISFNLEGIHHYDLGSLLDQMGFAVRTGNHCAQPLMNRMKLDGTVRVSFAVYNTTDEIDLFVQGVQKAQLMLL
jgi:cysteine desulfurase/selenocysteine lyase